MIGRSNKNQVNSMRDSKSFSTAKRSMNSTILNFDSNRERELKIENFLIFFSLYASLYRGILLMNKNRELIDLVSQQKLIIREYIEEVNSQ